MIYYALETFSKSTISFESKSFIYQHFDLANLVSEVVAIFQYSAKSKGIKLELRNNLKEPMAFLSKEDIKLALANIVYNSIKYSYRDKFVELNLENDENNYKITVKNFGVGIRENELKSIFQLGYRGQMAINQEITGSGLGLFASKNIIEAHKGSIYVSSVLVDNNLQKSYLNTFTILLPISKG